MKDDYQNFVLYCIHRKNGKKTFKINDRFFIDLYLDFQEIMDDVYDEIDFFWVFQAFGLFPGEIESVVSELLKTGMLSSDLDGLVFIYSIPDDILDFFMIIDDILRERSSE